MPIVTLNNERRIKRQNDARNTACISGDDNEAIQPISSVGLHRLPIQRTTENINKTLDLANVVAISIPNQEHERHGSSAVVFTENENPARYNPDGFGVTSRSHSNITRPRTSVTRPGTAATLFLESCSVSLYSEASFDENLSSGLSDWDDLPSIESMGSPNNQNVYEGSDLVLQNLEVCNIGDHSDSSIDGKIYSCLEESTTIEIIPGAIKNEVKHIHSSTLDQANCDLTHNASIIDNVSNISEDELMLTSFTEENATTIVGQN